MKFLNLTCGDVGLSKSLAAGGSGRLAINPADASETGHNDDDDDGDASIREVYVHEVRVSYADGTAIVTL